MAEADVKIGNLRWPVTLVLRQQANDPAGTGIVETQVNPTVYHADIQAVGALTFYAAEQTDRPVTHRIIMRWTDYLDWTHAIQRQTTRRDNTVRTETFRVRRIKELEGRKRFVVIEAELETAL